jgi:hypothetical protein
MNTGERGYCDALTGRVLGAVFEVPGVSPTNTLRIVYGYQIPEL